MSPFSGVDKPSDEGENKEKLSLGVGGVEYPVSEQSSESMPIGGAFGIMSHSAAGSSSPYPSKRGTWVNIDEGSLT